MFLEMDKWVCIAVTRNILKCVILFVICDVLSSFSEYWRKNVQQMRKTISKQFYTIRVPDGGWVLSTLIVFDNDCTYGWSLSEPQKYDG